MYIEDKYDHIRDCLQKILHLRIDTDAYEYLYQACCDNDMVAVEPIIKAYQRLAEDEKDELIENYKKVNAIEQDRRKVIVSDIWWIIALFAALPGAVSIWFSIFEGHYSALLVFSALLGVALICMLVYSLIGLDKKNLNYKLYIAIVIAYILCTISLIVFGVVSGPEIFDPITATIGLGICFIPLIKLNKYIHKDSKYDRAISSGIVQTVEYNLKKLERDLYSELGNSGSESAVLDAANNYGRYYLIRDTIKFREIVNSWEAKKY